jgi:hypothetical protein
MKSKLYGAAVLISAALLFSSQLALAQFTQQGPKLVGTGAVGPYTSRQGISAALSADGNTAIVGGGADNGNVGATWVFTRSGGVWNQQAKLVGSGAVGAAGQGLSVALSSDGNTAIIGGPGDNNNVGAAWVFTRSGGVWTQQGSKLVGTGAVVVANIPVEQGWSVALSGDGNTAIVGGVDDNAYVGAAWVFTRSGGVWTQQGSKLVGGTGQQGNSVALSGDGNTAIVGSPGDDNGPGAAWVYTRSNGVWTQQGSKLVGTGAVGAANQGWSVALSSDGNTAIVGGPDDGGGAGFGAAWVFIRSGGVWTQQGSKLVGAGAVGAANQGSSAALSGDGNTAIVGGRFDNNQLGAAWVFTRSNGVWTQQDSKLVGTGAVGYPQQGSLGSVALSFDGNTAIVGGAQDNNGTGAAWAFVQLPARADKTNTHDFNGDRYSDIAWRNTNGDTAIWLMSSAQVLSAADYGLIDNSWQIVGQRDFNGDGKADLLWRDTSGNVAIWEMNGIAVSNANSSFVANVSTSWSIVGTGDFNGDGMGDLLWQDMSGNVAIWEMNGTTILNQNSSFVANVPGQWSIVGTGDFNGDGRADILWRDTSGNVAIWEMNGTTILNANSSFVANVAGQWSIQLTGDFNDDGMSDILWQDTSGNVAIWEMNGTAVLNQNSSFVANVPGQWSVQHLSAE